MQILNNLSIINSKFSPIVYIAPIFENLYPYIYNYKYHNYHNYIIPLCIILTVLIYTNNLSIINSKFSPIVYIAPIFENLYPYIYNYKYHNYHNYIIPLCIILIVLIYLLYIWYI